MNRKLLFYCACYLCSCSDCPLYMFGCKDAPEELLLKVAREHYAEMKNDKDFYIYDTYIAKLFGVDYAKKLMAAKATVV